MCRSMVDIQSATAEIRRGKEERKKKKKKKKKKPQDENIMSASATPGGRNYCCAGAVQGSQMTSLQPSVGPSVTSGMHRTIVFVEYHSQFGQQLFLRGGINYERRPRTTKISILYTRKFHCHYTAYSVASLDLSLSP